MGTAAAGVAEAGRGEAAAGVLLLSSRAGLYRSHCSKVQQQRCEDGLALVAVAALMGAYYGGSAFANNQSAANAATLLNLGQQEVDFQL